MGDYKFIQIATGIHSKTYRQECDDDFEYDYVQRFYHALYGLDSDGVVWEFDWKEKTWTKLTT